MTTTDRPIIDWLARLGPGDSLAGDARPDRRVRGHESIQVDFGEAVGAPSRWITLRSLRILRWAGRASS